MNAEEELRKKAEEEKRIADEKTKKDRREADEKA